MFINRVGNNSNEAAEIAAALAAEAGVAHLGLKSYVSYSPNSLKGIILVSFLGLLIGELGFLD